MLQGVERLLVITVNLSYAKPQGMCRIEVTCLGFALILLFKLQNI